MTIRSIQELLTMADTNLPDNTTQLISAADVRVLIKDFLESIAPYYGAMSMAGPASVAVTATPAPVTPFSAVVQQDTESFVISLAQGILTRKIALAGVAGATTFFTITGSVAGANNANVTLTLYKNGSPTPYKASVTCTGTTDRVGFSLSAISYGTDSEGSGDADYRLYVSSPNAGNFQFSDVLFVAQAQPVRSF